MAGRGRPALSDADAAAQAVRIINIATAVDRGQKSRLAALGMTDQQARRLINKRHRGKVGAFIGDTLDYLRAPTNRTACAVRLVIEHGMPIGRAATRFNLDRRGLARACRSGWDHAAVCIVRQTAFRMRAVHMDFSADELPTRSIGR